MKYRSEYRLFLTVAYLIVLIAVLASFYLQQKQIDELHLSSIESQAISLLPVVQSQTRPVNAAENLIRAQLSKIDDMNAATSKRLVEFLKDAFGQRISIITLNPRGALLDEYGLTPQDSNDFQQFARDFFARHILNKTKISVHSVDFLKNTFDQTISLDFLPNFINIAQCRMHNQEGLAVIATLVNPVVTKNIFRNFALLNPPEAIYGNYFGSVMAFIPVDCYRRLEFIRQFSGYASEFYIQNRMVGDKSYIEDWLLKNGGTEAVGLFRQKMALSHQAVFRTRRQIYGFSRIGLEEGGTSSNSLFVLFEMESPDFRIIYREPGFLLLMLLNLLLFWYLNLRLKKVGSWDWGLKAKFVVFALAACLLPVAGLFYQGSLQIQLFERARERESFAKLESDISVIENGYQLKKNDLAIDLRVFSEKIDPSRAIDQNLIMAECEELNNKGVFQLYFANFDGSIDNFDTKADWASAETRAGTTFVKALLRFVLSNLKLKFEKEGSPERIVDKEGFMIESAAEAMGVQTIYQLVIHQNHFIPFKLIHGSVWAFLELFKNAEGDPTRLAMYAINRNNLTLSYLRNIQSDQNQKKPRIYLMNRSMMQIEKVAPNILEVSPVLINALKTVNNTGGSLKLRIEQNGEKALIVARQLRDLNWSCLAIWRESDRLIQDLNLNRYLAPAILLYLFVLIMFVASWLGNFFLKPVLELNKCANAIAGGNYLFEPVHYANDELGFLAANFSEMAAELKEKEFLNRFLSEIALDAISGRNTTRATRIEATVMFSDIRSFTTLSERYPPEQIGQMLNEYMTIMEKIIETHGGSIEKFIGDAIMAIFLPKMGMPHQAIRAANAAREMVMALSGFNQQRQARNLFPVYNGVGIASGELLMGTLGSHSGRRDFTVTGVTVNLAAEMEKWSKNAVKLPVILCSKSARILLEHKISCLRLEAVAEREVYELV